MIRKTTLLGFTRKERPKRGAMHGRVVMHGRVAEAWLVGWSICVRQFSQCKTPLPTVPIGSLQSVRPPVRPSVDQKHRQQSSVSAFSDEDDSRRAMAATALGQQTEPPILRTCEIPGAIGVSLYTIDAIPIGKSA